MSYLEIAKSVEESAEKQCHVLSLSGIDRIPKLIGSLKHLRTLFIEDCGIKSLPIEIGELERLEALWLRNNQLESIPPEIGMLSNLEMISINRNNLVSIPPEIGNLKKLRVLALGYNHLASLPNEICNLENLRLLVLFHNKLYSLPSGIWQLKKLEKLLLNNNELITISKDIDQLENLIELDLSNNQLVSIPPEVTKLNKLSKIRYAPNPLSNLSPVVTEGDKEALFSYLRDQLKSTSRYWVSKLMIVGEGGVGKTQLLRALQNKSFQIKSDPTHGLNVDSLVIDHPNEYNIVMKLISWDFGGQDIYHATHQFFFTNNSLFILVWNARHGYEQGKLYYWLDIITAKAPESTIIIVATHTEDIVARIPIREIKKNYLQIKGNYSVSNETHHGIDSLKFLISKIASGLPLMGEIWPETWMKASAKIRSMAQKDLSPEELWKITDTCSVPRNSAKILALWMHELGEILFFQDDDDLRDLIILKPEWVSKYICRIIGSEQVKEKSGILTRDHRDELWSDISFVVREHFLKLMERFDLSYRTLENREISYVIECLPVEPPDYETYWTCKLDELSCKEISMKFKLNTIPAGIPTWFIARSHRFTTYIHWIDGVLLADDKIKKTHLGLLRSFPNKKYVELSVRGPHPHNFFALLKDGFENTLNRYPGIKVLRYVPCPGHNGIECNHEFRYDHLLHRLEQNPPKTTIECPEGFEDVNVQSMLYGIAETTLEQIHHEIGELKKEGDQREKYLLSLLQREFSKQYRIEQSKIDSRCPTVFVLKPVGSKYWRKRLRGTKIELRLYCEAPGCWHPLKNGGVYTIENPAEWLTAIAPHVDKLVKFLKYVSPFIGPWVGINFPDYKKMVEDEIKLMEELVKKLPDIEETRDIDLTESKNHRSQPTKISGSSYRKLRKLLRDLDHSEEYGGLEQVLTPEGHYLWLCEHHALLYK